MYVFILIKCEVTDYFCGLWNSPKLKKCRQKFTKDDSAQIFPAGAEFLRRVYAWPEIFYFLEIPFPAGIPCTETIFPQGFPVWNQFYNQFPRRNPLRGIIHNLKPLAEYLVGQN